MRNRDYILVQYRYKLYQKQLHILNNRENKIPKRVICTLTVILVLRLQWWSSINVEPVNHEITRSQVVSE